MQQRVFTIAENAPVARGTYRLRLAGDTAAITAPGQFVDIRLAGYFLRRPVSVCSWSDGALTLYYKVAGAGTAAYLKSFGIRTRVRGKISDGSHEILDSIRSGYVSYIINTRSIHSSVHAQDGAAIRRCAVENGVTVFTSLDTVRVLLDVL